MANSNPLLYADKPVMAIAARTDRPNCRVSTGTIPGNSVCGGSQRRGSGVAVQGDAVVTCEGAWNQRSPGAPHRATG